MITLPLELQHKHCRKIIIAQTLLQKYITQTLLQNNYSANIVAKYTTQTLLQKYMAQTLLQNNCSTNITAKYTDLGRSSTLNLSAAERKVCARRTRVFPHCETKSADLQNHRPRDLPRGNCFLNKKWLAIFMSDMLLLFFIKKKSPPGWNVFNFFRVVLASHASTLSWPRLEQNGVKSLEAITTPIPAEAVVLRRGQRSSCSDSR